MKFLEDANKLEDGLASRHKSADMVAWRCSNFISFHLTSVEIKEIFCPIRWSTWTSTPLSDTSHDSPSDVDADPTWPQDSQPGKRWHDGMFFPPLRSSCTDKDAEPCRPSASSLLEDEGRVEGLKSSVTGEEEKVSEAVMQKSDMKTGGGRGWDYLGPRWQEVVQMCLQRRFVFPLRMVVVSCLFVSRNSVCKTIWNLGWEVQITAKSLDWARGI